MSCTTLVLFCCATICSVAKDIRYGNVTVLVDERLTISVPFEVKSFALSNKEVARVELTSPNTFRVTGRRNGHCELEVHGNMDMLLQRYEISVTGENGVWLQLECLRMDLECLPEVNVGIVSNHVRIDGEVSSLTKWKYLEEVLKGYKNLPLKNYVRFVPRRLQRDGDLPDRHAHRDPFCIRQLEQEKKILKEMPE